MSNLHAMLDRVLLVRVNAGAADIRGSRTTVEASGASDRFGGVTAQNRGATSKRRSVRALTRRNNVGRSHSIRLNGRSDWNSLLITLL